MYVCALSESLLYSFNSIHKADGYNSSLVKHKIRKSQLTKQNQVYTYNDKIHQNTLKKY